MASLLSSDLQKIMWRDDFGISKIEFPIGAKEDSASIKLLSEDIFINPFVCFGRFVMNPRLGHSSSGILNHV